MGKLEGRLISSCCTIFGFCYIVVSVSNRYRSGHRPKLDTQVGVNNVMSEIKILEIGKCSLDAAKCHMIGEVVYVPFPRRFSVSAKGEVPDFVIDVAKVPPVSFVHASQYKFGGIADAAASKHIPLKDGSGAQRLATKADDKRRCEKRFASIMDGTYAQGARGANLRPVPELLAECVAVVRHTTQKGVNWDGEILRSFRSGIDTEEATLHNVAIAWHLGKKGKVPSKAQAAVTVRNLKALAQKRLDAMMEKDLDAILADTE